eukprot:6460194-Amphidinium_carterae.1
MMQKIRSIFGVADDDYVMLMKGRYNDKCTLAFSTEKKAQEFWDKQRNQTVRDGESELRLRKDRTKTENHRSFLLREAKRELIQQGMDAEKIEVHYRSTTIYYKRKTI